MEILNRSLVLASKRNTFRNLRNIISRNRNAVRFLCSKQPQDNNSKISLFINPQIQELLQRITKVDFTKVFRPVQRQLSAPEYQFHTDEELQELLEEAKHKAKDKLQMPPVLEERKPIEEILSKDPEIQGYDETDSNLIFIDITPELMKNDRHIVVREPNGILRKAFWDERDNMLNIYFPIQGRQIVMPKMFEDDYLKGVLEKGWYEYILDRACIQFEPDDPKYIKVTQTVYSYVNEKRHFNSLRSTRHFGSMAFCLATQNKIDNLLLETIEKEFLEDAVDLVKLHHIIYPETESAKSASEHQDNFAFILDFIKKDSIKKSNLELSLMTLKELSEQRKLVQEGIEKAHGH